MKMLALLAGTALLPFAAQAQTTAPAATSGGAPTTGAAVTAGATVYDPQGGVAGTVDNVTAQAIVINTGTNKVGVPPSAVGKGAKGAVVSMTKAQLDAAYQQQAAQSGAQLQSQLTAGTQVRGAGGAVVGTVKSADAAFVTLTTPSGEAKLPIAGFAAGPQGPVIGLTAAQLDAAIAQAGGGTAAASGNAAAGADATATGGATTGTGTTASTGATAGGAVGSGTAATTAPVTDPLAQGTTPEAMAGTPAATAAAVPASAKAAPRKTRGK